MTKKRVLMALSGGLDSSMAAILLQEQGYDLIGITLRVYQSQFRSDPMEQSIRDATILAVRLNIPYYVFDVFDDFKQTVIDYFVNEYHEGRTPNPCALCNYKIKWNYLIRLADEFNCDYIATGHYAQVNTKNNRYYITEGIDNIKDQSYFLWRLSQEYLKRTLFPLGKFSKKEIKNLAAKKGLSSIATKKESYDICFIPEGDYRNFLKLNSNSRHNNSISGNFVNTKGQILGQHMGISNYTIGQRKGLGIAYTEPLYVKKINTSTNEIILCTKNELEQSDFTLSNLVLSKYETIPEDKVFTIKIRYKSPAAECTVSIKDNKLLVHLHKPVFAVTPGQSAVIFEENDLIAGGVID